MSDSCLRQTFPKHLDDKHMPGLYRPEINVRDTAFKRGTAYLERYCLLIAFTSYLERTRGSDITFQVMTYAHITHCQPPVQSQRLPCGTDLHHLAGSQCAMPIASVVVGCMGHTPQADVANVLPALVACLGNGDHSTLMVYLYAVNVHPVVYACV